MVQLDDVDRYIVSLLAANGRMSNEDLSRVVHLSRPAVHARVKRLQDAGIIEGYAALVDWRAMGFAVTAFLWVRTGGVRCADAAETILGVQADSAVVEECHRVAGEWCLLLKVRAVSVEHLQDLIDAVRDIRGVQATMSTIALSALWEQGRRKKSR